MITGAYQTTHGFHNHRSSRGPHDFIQIPEGVTTIPQIFKKEGYTTFNIGKEDYNFVFKYNDLYDDKAKKANPKYPWRIAKEAGKPFFGQIQLKGGKSNTRKVKNKVDPTKVTPPPYFPNHEIFRKWHAQHHDTARQTDLDTKALLDRLKEDGMLKNTIIFWFTDHGNNNSLRAKQFCTEIGTHVPLIISGPSGPSDLIKPDTTRNDLISLLDVGATSLALSGIKIPDYFDGQDLFAKDFKPRDFVISARDRCDYTIDTIRTVRTDRFRYIRNFKTDRPLLQPQYRDNRDYTKFLRQGHAEGTLPKLTDEIFFGKRPSEELYEIGKDPHEINNLANEPAYAEELKKHRDILNTWIKKTGDKGMTPEPEKGLKDVLKQWKDRCVNPEYDALKKKAVKTSPAETD